MNIFVLDERPVVCAQYTCDKHVVKMITETAQLLSTAVNQSFGPDARVWSLYRSTHINHPCSLWARQNRANFQWLVELGMALSWEYSYRYKKTHKSYTSILEASLYSKNFPVGSRTPFAQCMPEQYKNSNAVEAYRAYYRGEKAYFARWTKRPVPDWFK